MAAYEIVVNKKYSHIKLYTIVKSIKGEQNQISKFFSALANKYILKKDNKEQGAA